VSPGLERVREAAKQRKKERFTALLHHVTIDLLKDAYSWLKREAAPGVDGRTWQSYKQNLEVNLAELHSRIHRGTYRALPSRRRYIPKPDGRQRPLGIAALEDKIVQRVGKVRAIVASGQDTSDRVWPLCGRAPSTARSGQTGDI
jgi:RNA-directed DNA polymerase